MESEAGYASSKARPSSCGPILPGLPTRDPSAPTSPPDRSSEGVALSGGIPDAARPGKGHQAGSTRFGAPANEVQDRADERQSKQNVDRHGADLHDGESERPGDCEDDGEDDEHGIPSC